MNVKYYQCYQKIPQNEVISDVLEDIDFDKHRKKKPHVPPFFVVMLWSSELTKPICP